MYKLKTKEESAFPLLGQQFLTLSTSLGCRRIPKVSGQKTLPCSSPWFWWGHKILLLEEGAQQPAVLIFLPHKLPQEQAYLVNVFITYLLLDVLSAFPSLCSKIQGLSLSACYMVDVPKVRLWLEFREWDGGRNQSFLPPVLWQTQSSFRQASLPCGSCCHQAASRFNSKSQPLHCHNLNTGISVPTTSVWTFN